MGLETVLCYTPQCATIPPCKIFMHISNCNPFIFLIQDFASRLLQMGTNALILCFNSLYLNKYWLRNELYFFIHYANTYLSACSQLAH